MEKVTRVKSNFCLGLPVSALRFSSKLVTMIKVKIVVDFKLFAVIFASLFKFRMSSALR